MDFDSQVYCLSTLFYSDYPDPPYSEILRKKPRPYNCLLIETKEDYFMCIPYRTHMKHKYGYSFKNSVRSKANKSGLDYTKMVIITRSDYIDSAPALVDSDEYTETMKNINRIAREATEYLDDYIAYISGKGTISTQEFKRRYYASTLQYFYGELSLK